MKKIMKKKWAHLVCGFLLAASVMTPAYAQEPAAAHTQAAAAQTQQTAAVRRSVSEADPSGFVVLSEVVPDVILEVRYYSTYNFVGDRIAGYEEPCVLMTREAAEALKAVSDDVKAQGYRLKIYDAYRPQMAVANFVSWAEKLDDTRMKP